MVRRFWVMRTRRPTSTAVIGLTDDLVEVALPRGVLCAYLVSSIGATRDPTSLTGNNQTTHRFRSAKPPAERHRARPARNLYLRLSSFLRRYPLLPSRTARGGGELRAGGACARTA